MHAALTFALSLAAVAQAQQGLFTVNCDPLTVQRSDPLLYPGIASPHVHSVAGGTAFQRTESNQVAINAKNTTCDKVLDHSNYWVPQLYHENTNGSFSIVHFQGNAVYYLNRACNYTAGLQYCDASGYAIAPPAGLRMVSGNPTIRTYNDSNFSQRAIQHMCMNATGSKEFQSLPPEPCNLLRAEVFFPSCWDGVNLDPPDHTSHMAFPAIGDYNFGVCPQTHPVAIYSVFYEFYFDTSAIEDYNRLVYAMGDPTGYGFHGDFINGWTNQEALDNAMRTCTGPNGVNDPGCSLVVDGSAGHYTNQVPEVPAPTENIGLNGAIPALPGTNPVTGTPIKRDNRKLRRELRLH